MTTSVKIIALWKVKHMLPAKQIDSALQMTSTTLNEASH